MKNYYLPLLAVLFLLSTAHAQKKVLGYPFQFEKSFLAKGQYSTYFLDNPTDATFALILKDNKKAEYVWLGKDFKPIAKVSSAIENTLLDNQKHKYIGGTAHGGEYHFIYQTGTQFDMETVDFNAHTVGDKKILELPKSEKTIASFSDNNIYYCMTADDQSGHLGIYSVGADATLTKRDIPFDMPVSKEKLSGYFYDLAIIRSGEAPELYTTSQHLNKLFIQPGKLIFILNAHFPHVRVYTIDRNDFSVKDNDYDEGSALGMPDKVKGLAEVGISSIVQDSTLYSFGVNKNDIRIRIQRLSDGETIGQYAFNDDAAFSSFAGTPAKETRYIKEVDSKDLTTWKKLFDNIRYGGVPGCAISVTHNGQLLFTGGAVNLFGGPPSGVSFSGGGGGSYHGGFDHNSTTTYSNGMTVPNWNPNMYYVPGNPTTVFNAASGTYYTSTFFRLLLDPVTLKPVKGQTSRPLIEQIRDYVYAKGKPKAPNQFSIGKNQYFGYYDEDTQQYVIEQIAIH